MSLTPNIITMQESEHSNTFHGVLKPICPSQCSQRAATIPTTPCAAAASRGIVGQNTWKERLDRSQARGWQAHYATGHRVRVSQSASTDNIQHAARCCHLQQIGGEVVMTQASQLPLQHPWIKIARSTCEVFRMNWSLHRQSMLVASADPAGRTYCMATAPPVLLHTSGVNEDLNMLRRQSSRSRGAAELPPH